MYLYPCNQYAQRNADEYFVVDNSNFYECSGNSEICENDGIKIPQVVIQVK